MSDLVFECEASTLARTENLNAPKSQVIFPADVPLEDGMTPDATSYRNKAAEMRRFAQDARDTTSRQQFLDVAAQYDKLAQRAEDRAQDLKQG